jgi:hypothetical protein
MQALIHVIRPPEALFYANIVLNVEKKEVIKDNDSDTDIENSETPKGLQHLFPLLVSKTALASIFTLKRP